MNWGQFFQQQGKMLAQLEAAGKRQESTERDLKAVRSDLSSMKSLLDQQRGAYKASVVIAALVGALVTLAARYVGLWH
jgi:hypothetical protein